jgi:hypothetical protein
MCSTHITDRSKSVSIYKVIRSDSSHENDKDDDFVILFVQDNVVKINLIFIEQCVS